MTACFSVIRDSRQRGVRRSHRGLALPTIVVLLLLCAIAVAAAFRLGHLSELIVGNSSDYARTRAAADALMRDAEMDIRGSLPSYEFIQANGMPGYPCRPQSPGSGIPKAGFIGCRTPGLSMAAPTNPWFPYNWDEFLQVTDLVSAANAQGCMQGICRPQGTPIAENWQALRAHGVTYGQFTRVDLNAPGVAGNPVLSASGANARAWYWIEVFKYEAGLTPPTNRAPPAKGFVPLYRITVVATGLRAGTQVVLTQWFSPMVAS
jgi:type IV pilus assembly protein PilX